MTKTRRKTKCAKNDAAVAVTYTLEGVLAAWSDVTDYGVSFRAMTLDEQKAEVVGLNKGAITGMKGIIKKNFW